jgi:hypothetical protein
MGSAIYVLRIYVDQLQLFIFFAFRQLSHTGYQPSL